MNAEDFDKYMEEQFSGVTPFTAEDMGTFELPESFSEIDSLEKLVRAYTDYMSDFCERFYSMPPLKESRRHFLTWLAREIGEYDDILDAGCGIGLDVCYLQLTHPEKRFFAYDLSEKNIHKAKDRGEKMNIPARFIVASHDGLPFLPQSFGAIYMNHSLMQEDIFLDPNSGYAERIIFNRINKMAEYLRPGGILADTHSSNVGHNDAGTFWNNYAAEQAGLIPLRDDVFYGTGPRYTSTAYVLQVFKKPE